MKKEWAVIICLTIMGCLGGVVGCLNENNTSTPKGGNYGLGGPNPTFTPAPSLTPTATVTATPTATPMLFFPTPTPTPTL